MSSRARTPSPSACIREPPAPRLGFHDDWQPFAPRKSARIADRTPSPRAARKVSSPQQKTASSSISRASMVSPMQSPRKRAQPHDTGESSSRLTANSTAHAANALGIDFSKTPKKTAATRAVGMLPTPTKTPHKTPSKEAAASGEVSSFASKLFQSTQSDLMPSNKRRAPKKYSGMTLESFTAETAEEPIEIFTDSKDRVPEIDNSLENPFYGQSTTPETRRSKRRNVSVPGEKRQSVEELAERDDGMTYVFRGKRVFRKFAPEQEPDESSNNNGIFSRSSIKPKLLFPSKPQPSTMDEIDEEAATDIEEGNEDLLDDELEVPQTPVKTKSSKDAATPSAPRFAPVSPPDTKRTTRSANKLIDDPEMTPAKKKTRRSVFDSWPRTKDQKATGTKREAEQPLGQPPAKRTKA